MRGGGADAHAGDAHRRGNFGDELPDILEKLAYNALPAAFNADMTAHQYDQQANQIKVSRDKRNWYNNGEDANVFGFSPNFGCCTANYHQGWPKFVSSSGTPPTTAVFRR